MVKRSFSAYRSANMTRFATRPVRTVSVYVPLPVSVARKVRTVNYPYPAQILSRSRSTVIPLRLPRERFVIRKVSIRLPRVLPYLAPSAVAVDRGAIRVRSQRQTRAVMRREFNRRRYEEHKTNRRKARHGQLNSPGADRFGIVAEGARRGYGVRQLADAALVARALSG